MAADDTQTDFFASCGRGDTDAVRDLLDLDPTLVSAVDPGGTTALHLAVRHPATLALLLERGGDPNVRDRADNALPLHFAAGDGRIEAVRLLLDAGSDVQGAGDAHRLGVIGWAGCFWEPYLEVVELLLKRGARHHAFSAVACRDMEALGRVLAEDPAALTHRLSEHEQEQTALHWVVAPPDGLAVGTFRDGWHYGALRALIEAGADLEAEDSAGRTALEVAMLRGDMEAARILQDAGARGPSGPSAPEGSSEVEGTRSAMASTVSPMLAVPDMQEAVDWFEAVGFRLVGSHGEGPEMGWAALAMGEAEVMLIPDRSAEPRGLGGVTLWFRVAELEGLYERLRARRLRQARSELDGEDTAHPRLVFTADLHLAVYGQMEFGIRGPAGLELQFTDEGDES